ncbi:MAG: ROK family protein, partial [Bacteroidota bacterium]|nr:ROK family protein [Bacteroidota bacterium]
IKQLYVKGSKSNSDLCSHLNISIPTSIGLLNELIAEGFVEKQGRGLSIGGRKPDLYGLKDDSLYVLSISMEQFSTNMAIFDNNNNKKTSILTLSIPISKDLEAVETLCSNANDLINESGIDREKLIGTGISMPGLISSKEGINYTYLNSSGENQSLQELLEEKFKKPVYIQNDAKSSALAELKFGLAKGKKDVLVLSMDWGIGLGIIMDGKLISGTSGFSGEFGHIPLSDEGLLCQCGKRGCLETVASSTALVQIAKEGIKSGEFSLLNNLSKEDLENLKAHHIIDAANKGDQFAIYILSKIGINLGKGIAVLIQLFNPELIILGGKIADAKQYISTPVQHAINTYCMKQLSEKTHIHLSELGENAGIMGSIATVMDNIFENH